MNLLSTFSSIVFCFSILRIKELKFTSMQFAKIYIEYLTSLKGCFLSEVSPAKAYEFAERNAVESANTRRKKSRTVEELQKFQEESVTIGEELERGKVYKGNQIRSPEGVGCSRSENKVIIHNIIILEHLQNQQLYLSIW